MHSTHKFLIGIYVVRYITFNFVIELYIISYTTRTTIIMNTKRMIKENKTT